MKRQQSAIRNPKSEIPAHSFQAGRLRALGISHRAAARDLGAPASTFSAYMLTGVLPDRLKNDFAERVDRYIKMKSAQVGHGNEIRGPSLRGHFGQLCMSLNEIAEKTGVDRVILTRGIYRGLWPDETTQKQISTWMERELDLEREDRVLTKISLSEEVLDHFGLKRDPFTNEMGEAEDIFDTKELRDAEKVIMRAVDKAGWTAVTGEIGSGKSTLLKRVESRLVKKKDVLLVKPRIIEKQFLGASHVCDSILQDIGSHAALTHRTLEFKARLVGRTLEECFRDGKKVVILIDEAHLLRDDALLALKRIYEFEIGFKKLLAIILVGQVGLARRLKTNFNLAEVSQRVDLYEIGSLNGALGSYVRHKLERAGSGDKEIFEPAAIKAMADKADTPLAVNNVAAAALIAAWDVGEKKVTAQTVKGL